MDKEPFVLLMNSDMMITTKQNRGLIMFEIVPRTRMRDIKMAIADECRKMHANVGFDIRVQRFQRGLFITGTAAKIPESSISKVLTQSGLNQE